MTDIKDFEVDLLFARPTEYKEFKIYPLTIDEIKEYGFTEYNRIIGLLSLDEEEIQDNYGIFDVNVYDLVIISIYNNDDFKDNFLKLFSSILKTPVSFHIDNYFITEDKIIDADIFYGIIGIILDQNVINKKKYQIKSKKEKEYYEMVKKAKEKYKKYLDSENDSLILDIISSVGAKHPSLNIFNIGKLTIYQLFDQFHRLNYIDEYYISIKSMLAGAENIKLEHWSRKIKFN